MECIHSIIESKALGPEVRTQRVGLGSKNRRPDTTPAGSPPAAPSLAPSHIDGRLKITSKRYDLVRKEIFHKIGRFSLKHFRKTVWYDRTKPLALFRFCGHGVSAVCSASLSTESEHCRTTAVAHGSRGTVFCKILTGNRANWRKSA